MIGCARSVTTATPNVHFSSASKAVCKRAAIRCNRRVNTLSDISEQWMAVRDFPAYQISNLGRLRSSQVCLSQSTPPEGRILKGGLDKDGYRRAVLYNNGVRKSLRFAQMVALAWLPTRPPGTVLCHDNGINTDNRATNLVYKTQRANIADKERHGTKLFGEQSPNAVLSEAEAREILISAEHRRVLATRYGVHPCTIDGIRQRRNWTHLAV